MIRIGQWVTIELYFRPGSAGQGRFFLACNGQTVFDVRNRDFNLGGSDWFNMSFLKTYLDLRTTNWMREHGTPAATYYDNLEVWTGLPRQSPAHRKQK